MGAAWRDRPEWRVVDEIEAALGRPLAPLLLGNRPLHGTAEVQLAMFAIGMMAWEGAAGRAEPPVAFAGHSLGQITALVAAGVVGREEGCRLVHARGEATQRAAMRRPGRMVALLGAEPAQAEAVCAAAPGECWIANLNAPGQVVLGGTNEGIEAAVAAAGQSGVRRVRPLDVDGAFHTPLMAEAVDELRPVVESLSLQPGAAPVVANDDASEVTDVGEWPQRLLDHLVRPVRWEESVRRLRDLGARRLAEPGGATLSGLLRRIAPELEAEPITGPVAGVVVDPASSA